MYDSINEEKIFELIDSKRIVLLYFGQENCSVCTDMKPKILKILEKYKNIRGVFLNVNNNLELARKFNIYTIPAILVYTEGKESIREARYLSINKLEEDIERYYNLIFDNQEVF